MCFMSQVTNSNLNTKSNAKKLACQKYEPGAEIPILDSGVWQVDQGIVQLSRLRTDGNEVIVGFVTTGNNLCRFCFLCPSNTALQFDEMLLDENAHSLCSSPE
jgi:hypothetical protein